ncbi:hypothetical protein Agabi119p4_8199 [Agaricus bisporus var. burnettii]|uniref:Brain protein I3 n=1 Tax=Agaricus bisporus var. burnettii TaxID=192524 RepID=A0A8H7EY56_AGABI|nr:hypothetical protein Agabi119p4_8199 [Agaricus bisporus var. burnettii]
MNDGGDALSYANTAEPLEQPQLIYIDQQTPGIEQQPLPGMGYQYTMSETGQPQMIMAQPRLTLQHSTMSMNTKVGLGQQPIQPQATGVMMTGMTPGMMLVPNYLALCQQGHHAITTRYGPCGIITAVILFPIGLLALLVDVEKRCTRCGATF